MSSQLHVSLAGPSETKSNVKAERDVDILAPSSYPTLSQSRCTQANAPPVDNMIDDMNFFSNESVSPVASTSYANRRNVPQVIARSPRSETHSARRSARRAAKADNLSLPTTPQLLENTLKLASLAVSATRPNPITAPKVTLSNRCRPDAKVVFDQSHFVRATGTGTEDLAIRRSSTGGIAYTDDDLVAKANSGTASICKKTANLNGSSHHSSAPSISETNTQSSSSPSSSIEPLPAVTTPASSMIVEADSAGSSSAALPSSPILARRVTAWSKPRSWADLATHIGSSAISGPSSSGSGAIFSESVNGNETQDQASAASMSNTASPVRRHRAESVPRQATKKNGVNGLGSAMSLASIISQAETQFAAPLTYPRGMINKGNLCFANAILQVLVYCAPFYNLFRLLGENVPHDFHNSTPLMEAVIHFLAEFHVISDDVQRKFVESPSLVVDTLRDIQAASEPFIPEPLYDAMKLNKRFDTMRRGHQEDAEEFLGFFLDTLHEELQSTIHKAEARLLKANGVAGADTDGGITHVVGEKDEERELKRPMSPSEGDGWLEVGQKGKTSFTRTMTTAHSPITRIFGGKLRSVLRTPGSKDSVTLEPYQPLQLDIQPAHVTTIEEALENLTRPEIISGVLSSTRAFVDATKQVLIETLPPVLVVHLKRFYYDDIGGVQKSSKILGYGPTLEIPESVVSPARRAEALRRYKLFGIVYHHGRYASGGHYTVDVLRQDRSEWLHIDDTTWHPVNTPSAKATSLHTTTGIATPMTNTAPSSPKITAGQALLPSSTSSHSTDGGSAYLLFYAREDAIDASSSSITHKAANSLAANGLLPPISVRKLAETATAGPPPIIPGAAPSPLRKSIKNASPAQQRRPRV